MSKFPPALARPDFAPAQDPTGFDREAIQPSLFADIEEFFKTHCRERLNGKEAAADTDGDGFGTGGDAELGEDLRDVEFGGVTGDAELGGDLFVAEAAGEHAKDLVFARGERLINFWIIDVGIVGAVELARQEFAERLGR